MATILIVEEDERTRRELSRLPSRHCVFITESAERAWALVGAGFRFDEVFFYADPAEEVRLQAAVDRARRSRPSPDSWGGSSPWPR